MSWSNLSESTAASKSSCRMSLISCTILALGGGAGFASGCIAVRPPNTSLCVGILDNLAEGPGMPVRGLLGLGGLGESTFGTSFTRGEAIALSALTFAARGTGALVVAIVARRLASMSLEDAGIPSMTASRFLDAPCNCNNLTCLALFVRRETHAMTLKAAFLVPLSPTHFASTS